MLRPSTSDIARGRYCPAARTRQSGSARRRSAERSGPLWVSLLTRFCHSATMPSGDVITRSWSGTGRGESIRRHPCGEDKFARVVATLPLSASGVDLEGDRATSNGAFGEAAYSRSLMSCCSYAQAPTLSGSQRPGLSHGRYAWRGRATTLATSTATPVHFARSPVEEAGGPPTGSPEVGGMPTARAEGPVRSEVEALQKLKLFSDRSVVPPHLPHMRMLYPFWGVSEIAEAPLGTPRRDSAALRAVPGGRDLALRAHRPRGLRCGGAPVRLGVHHLERRNPGPGPGVRHPGAGGGQARGDLL